MSYFEKLRLLPVINQALDALEFKKPTPIQEKAIPIILKGTDVIGNAQTGTGKTAAFCIPTLTYLLNNKAKAALILVPTRELAGQIDRFWKALTQFCPEVTSIVITGAVPMATQLKRMEVVPRLIIATPGRLVDHLQLKNFELRSVGVLILDEADRMLDMGFRAQLDEIARAVPQKRQTLLFSATWDGDISELAKKVLSHQMVRITAGKTSQAAQTVEQALIKTTESGKRDLLLEEINAERGQVLIFTSTQAKVESIGNYLEGYGIEVNSIHGGRTQGNRNTALKQFREHKIKVLIATDIAARGIDVPEITHVINYDMPQIADDYIHRIGRTGRASLEGKATSFLTLEDETKWVAIVELLKRTGSTIPKAVTKRATRAANIQDVESEMEVALVKNRKPTRSHPGARRENQWAKGTVNVKPAHEQRIKPKA
ncbi:MAG: DEAD/DEAH box helicase [Bdellovibrionales bacterium]|nr:DEAD/DEAH box helicase [Bdellovibrionales bacterium]